MFRVRASLFLLESVKNILQYGIQVIFDREYGLQITANTFNVVNLPELGSQDFYARASEESVSSNFGVITLPSPNIAPRISTTVMQTTTTDNNEQLAAIEEFIYSGEVYPPNNDLVAITNPTITRNIETISILDNIPMEEFMLCSLPTLISIPTGAIDLYGEVFTIMTDNIFSSLENQTEPGPCR